MSTIKDLEALLTALKKVDEKIDLLNDQKIIALFESLGLDKRNDIPKDYLRWGDILIISPNTHISNEVKRYKYSISRISFLTNPNAQQIHIFDFAQWKNASRNKTRFQIRELLKTNFGGVKK